MSSCCPAFVRYIKTAFPDLEENISHNLSPMAAIGKYLKETYPGCKTVFIGPCTAKKAEIKLDGVKEYVDSAITFEELQALFDSRDIDITSLPEENLAGASRYGRAFAKSCGVSNAIVQGLKEHGVEFDVKSMACDGIEACRTALLRKSKNVLDANFIEGMACVGGCVGGAGCLTHGPQNKLAVDKYSDAAKDTDITGALSALNQGQK